MGLEMRVGHQGTGPGAITPDGCAVELYSRLQVGAAPDVIVSAVPGGARMMGLGCGVGRVTHTIVERGFVVKAVGESVEKPLLYYDNNVGGTIELLAVCYPPCSL